MDQDIDVVECISNLLDKANYKEALNVTNDEKYCNSFKDNCWDLVSVIVGKIQDDTIILKPSLYSACEELLLCITKKATPEEALLEFIEQIEVAKNDAQFSIILTPLQELLQKLIAKRKRSLEWCLNSISTYIEAIPIPHYQLDDKERLLMDCDSNVRRITKVYSTLPPFYQPFIKELNIEIINIEMKQIMCAFLISLLGKPLIYIDLDPEFNATSQGKKCCDTLIQDICTIEKDIYKFLIHLEICYKESKKCKQKNIDINDFERSPYEHREKINMTSLSALFYVVISGHFQIPDIAFPQVYCFEYVVHTIMLSALHLLNFTEYGPLSKGISLCDAVLKRFHNNVSYTLLSSPVHFDMCKILANVAIFSTYESLRKKAVVLIGTHINKFDYKGRYMLIKYVIETANHSGIIGYAITLFKNSMNEAFKDPTLPECFTGAQLMNMIKKICYLPFGAESDMVELADQIISSLNFLRYLALKDTANASGIRDCFSIIDSVYLEKLRTGLNMSKVHYEVKLKDLEEGKTLSEDKINVSINVAGNVLDKIPTENKKEIIKSALNVFHLIEGLVARLSECININKMQGLTVDCE